MDPSDFPGPQPTRIERVSPSLANQLQACELRVAFSRDANYKHLRRPSTYSVLGEVAHAVSEAAHKTVGHEGDLTGARVWLEQRWDDEVEKKASKLKEAWSPAVPPPPVEWPGYNLTRARTLRLGARLMAERVPATGAEQVAGTGTEIDLEDSTSGLYGRADRIERSGGSTRIVDLKSGLRQGEPTKDQRRQLLLYAVLAQRANGTWPSEIAIEDASGAQMSIEFDPEAAEEALAEALDAVDLFNEHITTVDFRTTAAPEADRCRWCAFRVVCGPYWQELRSDWGHRSAFGTVDSAGTSPQGGFVRIHLDSPIDLAGRQLHVSALAEAVPGDASHAAVVDVSGTIASEDVRARWSTVVRTW